jgi:site-specific DNA-methyltransferase (adenine-specific)
VVKERKIKMNKLKVEYIPITEIKPYENNPRINDNAVEAVANSIKEFGFKNPIILDKNNVIIAGHKRYKASLQLGLKEVPCIHANDLTEEQVKALRIADNKTAEKANWDMSKLKIEIGDINLDMTDFGFGQFELSMLDDDYSPEGYDDDLIDDYSKPEEELLKSKRIIITYEGDEQEEFLKKVLKQDELKVAYKCEKLMEEYSENEDLQ